MLKRKLIVVLAAGALLSGLGVASALADDHQPSQPTTSTTANENEQGGDEQGAATDVTEAADDVEVEATNQAADDDQGDENDNAQGSDDD